MRWFIELLLSALGLWKCHLDDENVWVLFRAPFYSKNRDAGVEHGQAEFVLNGVHEFLSVKNWSDAEVVLTELLEAFAAQQKGGACFCSLNKGLFAHSGLLWEGNFGLRCCQRYSWCISWATDLHALVSRCVSSLFKVVFAPCWSNPSSICGMFCVLGCQGVSPSKCSSLFPCPECLPSCLCCFQWAKTKLGKQDVDVSIWCIVFHIKLESKFANSLLYITAVREHSGEKRSVFILYSFQALFIRESK